MAKKNKPTDGLNITEAISLRQEKCDWGVPIYSRLSVTETCA